MTVRRTAVGFSGAVRDCQATVPSGRTRAAPPRRCRSARQTCRRRHAATARPRGRGSGAPASRATSAEASRQAARRRRSAARARGRRGRASRAFPADRQPRVRRAGRRRWASSAEPLLEPARRPTRHRATIDISTLRRPIGPRSASYVSSSAELRPSPGRPRPASSRGRRPSAMAVFMPRPPRGVIRCAASPTRKTRPARHASRDLRRERERARRQRARPRGPGGRPPRGSSARHRSSGNAAAIAASSMPGGSGMAST